jgi:hypothetical protein
MIEGVFCLRIKSWNFFVRVGREVSSRDSRWDDDRGARLATSADDRELRAERRDEVDGNGAIVLVARGRLRRP